MLTFIDEKGGEHLVQAEIKTGNSVNGERSITGEIYSNDTVIHSIGRGWKLEFEDETYCITYALPVDDSKNVVVEFDAIHQFFFDFDKSVVYKELNGSHTFVNYLEFIFKDSGYSYRNEVQVDAFEKQNFGMKNRLVLFKDLISSVGVEYTVSGKVVRIVNKVGSDLSTIVKKGFNLQELKLEHNIGEFITYKKGYGAFIDPDDETKGRLEVEYRSPLADVYGLLEGDPIVDERYTVADNLRTRLKNEVDNSFSISVDLTMEDLLGAGYEQERPHAGDYIMAINEDVGFQEKIRIVSFTSSYSVDGELFDHQVTCNSISMASKQSKSEKAWKDEVQVNVENAITTAEYAAISANGKNKTFTGLFGPDGKGEPKATLVGDTWYKPNGEETEVYRWDGQSWELLMSTKDNKIITEKITEVETATDQAQKDADKAMEESAAALDKSGQALSNAQTANNTANAAKQQAFNSEQLANSAKQDAINAQGTASTAKTTADKAIVDAQKALDDLDNMEIGGRNWLLNSEPAYTNTSALQTYPFSFKDNDFKVGQEVTISFYIKNNTPENGNSVDAMFRDSTLIEGTISQVFAISTKLERYSYSIILTESIIEKTTSFSIRKSVFTQSPRNSAVLNTTIEKVQIETGKILSDWTTAPEDVQVQIATINNELTSKVSQTTFNTLDGKVNTQQTQINQNKSDITSKADKSEVNTLKGTVETQGTKINQNAEEIEQRATKTEVNTLTGRVSNTETTVSTQAGQITALNTKTDGNTTQIGKLQSDYTGLSSTVSKVETELGYTGRNLLDTTNWVSGQYSTSTGNLVASSVNMAYTKSITATSQDFTIQVWVEPEHLKSGNVTVVCYSDTGVLGGVLSSPLVAGRNIKQFKLRTGTTYFKVSLPLNQAGLIASKYMLEVGNAVNDWSPAPEDLTTKTEFSSFQQTVNGFQTSVNSDISGIKSQQTQMAGQISSKVEKAEFNTLSSTVNSQQTEIIQLSDQLTSTVNKVETVDSKVTQQQTQITQLSGQVSTTVTKVENLDGTVSSQQTQITQLGNQISFQAQQIDSVDGQVSAQQAQITLLTNNINLKVDKNNAIAQINLSPENIRLDAKFIRISGTTMIDDAVIKSAMIDSLNAGKVTTGTLNASNVNIINMNASNIVTGTISGANLRINLNTGEVLFNKGLIKKLDDSFILDLDNGYITNKDPNRAAYFLIRDGGVKFYDRAPSTANPVEFGGMHSEQQEYDNKLKAETMIINGTNGVYVKTKNFNEGGRFTFDSLTAYSEPSTGAGLIVHNASEGGQAYLHGEKYLSLTVGVQTRYKPGTGTADVYRSGIRIREVASTTAGASTVNVNMRAHNAGPTIYSYSEFNLTANGQSQLLANGSLLVTSAATFRAEAGSFYFKTGTASFNFSSSTALLTMGTGVTSVNLGSSSSANCTITLRGKVTVNENSVFNKNLSVIGTKNAIHETSTGWVATPAYETAESYLGDIGTGVTDENGNCTILIEKIFGETVNTKDYEYQVFLQSYSYGSNVFVITRDEKYFVVKSDKPSTNFVYEIKAKRKNYEKERLVLQKDFKEDNKHAA